MYVLNISLTSMLAKIISKFGWIYMVYVSKNIELEGHAGIGFIYCWPFHSAFSLLYQLYFLGLNYGR